MSRLLRTGIISAGLEPPIPTFFNFSVNTANAGSASDTIILPFTADQDLTIEWDTIGDPGVTEDITAAAQATHVFPGGAGTYFISIKQTNNGKVKFLKFNNGGDKAKLLDISSWDALDITESIAFRGCTSLTVSATNLPLITTLSVQNMFRDCTSLISVPLFDMSLVNTITNMFHSCVNLTSVPLFDLSSVTSSLSVFNGCTSLVSVPLFDLSSSITTSQMFFGCTDLTSVPSFNLMLVTNTSSMFSACTSLTTIGFTRADSMTNGTNMFLNVTLDTADWSDFLDGLSNNNLNNGVTIDGGNSLRNALGDTAFDELVGRSWIVQDGTP